jgi:hypothetical protein
MSDDGEGSITSSALLRREDPLARVILADLAEASGKAARYWNLAVEYGSTDLDAAFSRLADLDVLINSIIAPNLEELRGIVSTIIDRLDVEVPDPDQ